MTTKKVDQWLEHLSSKGRLISHDLGAREKEANNEELKMDNILCEKGRAHFQRNFFTLMVNMLIGLYAILFVPSIARILKITGKSRGRVGSFLRYLSTLTHAIEWFRGTTKMTKSLKEVLQMHRAASLKGERVGYQAEDQSKDEKMRQKTAGISQYDMVITQWGFIGPSLVFPDKLAVHTKERAEVEGFVHIFYLVGKSLGILDEFNLCSGGLEPTKERCDAILRQVIQASVVEGRPVCREMADSLLHGINLLNPLISQLHFRRFTEGLLLQANDPPPSISIEGFYVFFFQRVLSCVYLRWLTWPMNKLLLFNFWLADQWKSVISRDAENAMEGKQSSLDRFLAVLNIPRFAVISVSSHLASLLRRRIKNAISN